MQGKLAQLVSDLEKRPVLAVIELRNEDRAVDVETLKVVPAERLLGAGGRGVVVGIENRVVRVPISRAMEFIRAAQRDQSDPGCLLRFGAGVHQGVPPL